MDHKTYDHRQVPGIERNETFTSSSASRCSDLRPTFSDMRGEDIVVAAIHRLKVEVWWMVATRQVLRDPTFPPKLRRRVPGAHCPVAGCSHHCRGDDDPPLTIPAQR